MKNTIDSVMQRPARYWFIDGLSELSFAALSFLLGLYFYGLALLPEDSLIYQALDVGMILIVLAGAWGGRKMLVFLKNQITFPRTGYVSFQRKTPKHRWAALVMSMLVAAVVSTMFVTQPASLAWMPAVTGIILAGILVVIAYRHALWRYYGLALVALLSGTGLSLAGIGDIYGLGFFYLILSAALAVSGGLTLWGYLRHTQPPSQLD